MLYEKSANDYPLIPKNVPKISLKLKLQLNLNQVAIVRFAAVLQSGAHSRPDIKNRKDRF